MKRPAARAPRTRPSFRWGGAVALLIAGGASLGCGPAHRSDVPVESLPPYEGREAQLFDDGIEPASVGLDLGGTYAPKTDPKLRERAQIGDAVLRVRITTVTSRNDGPEPAYQLGLSTVEVLHGRPPSPMARRFDVQIRASNESHGIVKSFESRLVGRPFIAFVRAFAHGDGERDLHFHLTSDTDEVKTAVSDAIAIGGIR